MKNVSIIQSAITHFDWFVLRRVVRERERRQRERDAATTASECRRAPHCCPGTVGGISFCETGGSFSPRRLRLGPGAVEQIG